MALILHRLTYYTYLLFGFLFVRSSGPPYWMVGFVTFLLRTVLRYRKEVITKNMSRVFSDKNNQEIKLLQNKFYTQFATTLVEVLYSYSHPKKILERIEFLNFELINSDIKSGQQIIICGGHFYNWEWIGSSLYHPCPFPVFGIYKPLSNPYFDRHLLKTRAELGVYLIPMRETTKIISEQYEKGQNSIFLLASDQSPTHTQKSIWVDFFGTELPFFPGIQKFAQQFDMSVYYVNFECPKRGHYTVRLEPLNVEDGEYTAAYAREIEKSILKHPESWLWSHNRWKHSKED